MTMSHSLKQEKEPQVKFDMLSNCNQGCQFLDYELHFSSDGSWLYAMRSSMNKSEN